MSIPCDAAGRVLVYDDRDTLWPKITALLCGIKNPTIEVQAACCEDPIVEVLQEAIDENQPFSAVFWSVGADPDKLSEMSDLWEVDSRLSLVVCTGSCDYRWQELADIVGQSGPWYVLEGTPREAEVCQLVLNAVSHRLALHSPEFQQMRMELERANTNTSMLEICNGALHNIGNVLNSVSVSAGLVCDSIGKSKTVSLQKASELIEQHQHDLSEFITKDERGKHLPQFLIDVSKVIGQENQFLQHELSGISQHLEHIKQIIGTQQSYAGHVEIIEEVDLTELIEDALKINIAGLDSQGVQVIREFDDVPRSLACRNKVLQILVNLISNAKAALRGSSDEQKLWLRLHRSSDNTDYACVQVIDNGVGITADNLKRIFDHGFTTRSTGHGFGLNSAIRAAREMKGRLWAESDGLDRGASFTLELPLAYQQLQQSDKPRRNSA